MQASTSETAAAAAATTTTGSSSSTPSPASSSTKLKLTCENCVRAKVKCSGPPGPCERCSGWRNLDCVFLEERKRGRPRLHREGGGEGNPSSADGGTTSKMVKHANSTSSLGSGKGEIAVDRDGETTKKGSGSSRMNGKQQIPVSNTSMIVREPKLTCVTSDCWSSIEEVNKLNAVPGPSASPSAGLSHEQSRVVEIFFDLYKNHASSRSCCRAWFSRQLNKICGILKNAQSLTALLSVVEWMNKHQILVAPMMPPEQKAFSDPDSGFLLPPMTSSKGPLLLDEGIHTSLTSAPNDQMRMALESHDVNVPCIFLQYQRDERCFVRTNEAFVGLFGRDASFYAEILDSLYGGILPWGADVFCNILTRPIDTLLLIRVLAFRFQSLPRMMDATPITRTVQTSHLFTCTKHDGSLVDCIVRFTHVENVSFQGVSVEVTATFEPYASSAVTAQEQCEAMTAAKQQQQQQQQPHQEHFVVRSGLGAASPTAIASSPRDAQQSEAPMFTEDYLIDSDDVFFFRNGGGETNGSKGEYRDEWMEDLLKWVDEHPRDDQGMQ